MYRNTLASRAARADGRNKDADKLKASCGMIPRGRCQGERSSENLQALTMVGMADSAFAYDAARENIITEQCPMREGFITKGLRGIYIKTNLIQKMPPSK